MPDPRGAGKACRVFFLCVCLFAFAFLAEIDMVEKVFGEVRFGSK